MIALNVLSHIMYTFGFILTKSAFLLSLNLLCTNGVTMSDLETLVRYPCPMIGSESSLGFFSLVVFQLGTKADHKKGYTLVCANAG